MWVEFQLLRILKTHIKLQFYLSLIILNLIRCLNRVGLRFVFKIQNFFFLSKIIKVSII